MRYLMQMIPHGYQKAKPGFSPDPQMVAEMARYNESLKQAGALISLDGLHPPSEGARVVFHKGKAKVTHGPFRGAKETLGGYWIIKAASLEEALEWAQKVPAAEGDTIEVRQIQEMEEFPLEVQKAVQAATQMPAH